MADEATVMSSLRIQRGNITYQGQPTQFTATVTGAFGPTPGAMVATVNGTDVDLSALTDPGLCRIQNLDATNFVKVGTWDPETQKFYPLMKLLPGESYVIRLADDVGDEYSGTGTSTSPSTATNTLRIKANNASCNVLVEAFEA